MEVLMDRHDAVTRSRVMGAVRAAGTMLEKRVVALLLERGISDFEMNAKDLPGRPDIVIRDSMLAVFIDSCFWHGCPQHLRMPETNVEYWEQKIIRNRERDRRVSDILGHLGWNVVRIWEHELNNADWVTRKLGL